MQCQNPTRVCKAELHERMHGHLPNAHSYMFMQMKSMESAGLGCTLPGGSPEAHKQLILVALASNLALEPPQRQFHHAAPESRSGCRLGCVAHSRQRGKLCVIPACQASLGNSQVDATVHVALR